MGLCFGFVGRGGMGSRLRRRGRRSRWFVVVVVVEVGGKSLGLGVGATRLGRLGRSWGVGSRLACRPAVAVA